ncbi:MAG: aspartate carbamoyltransferase [Chitinivibrionales bacterium]|nr:aspartate carbamoyltransferase [Chitinivibrionales bacterium]
MNDAAQFKGRTIAVVNDLSLEEQVYLFNKTRELKEALVRGCDCSSFKINDPSMGIYLLFLEDSTRTKESFRNAASFHTTKLNIFDAQSSSFNKMESYADTIRMLCGYSTYSIFVIRSKLEGVCRWLESAMKEYADRNGLQMPSFINAGDGKHEHPTQELLDEFSFYEQKAFNRDHIHIALIGDLYHGRTTHSKSDGLRLFNNVEVDLIAPDELRMPSYYKEKMKANNFKIREFASLPEYLAQKKIADTWYFTRLQLERMGEDVREKADFLRDSVTFKKEYFSKVMSTARFYHPLPRHREHPTIPFFLDKTELNGWEKQAINGYFTRIIELSMLGGKIGADFHGEHPLPKDFSEEFVREVTSQQKGKKHDYKIGILPITHGVVIDHIGKGDQVETIWEHINKIRRILNLNVVSSHGVFQSEKDGKYKGLIAIPNMGNMERSTIKKLGAIAPGCTLNVIKDHQVTHKYRIHMPPRIYNFDEISCKNPDCISHPSNHEYADVIFNRSGDGNFTCAYCEHSHEFKKIWNL